MFDDCILVKPAGSPGYEFALPEESDATKHGVGSSLVYRIPEMQIHLRLHDYFMGSFQTFMIDFFFKSVDSRLRVIH